MSDPVGGGPEVDPPEAGEPAGAPGPAGEPEPVATTAPGGEASEPGGPAGGGRGRRLLLAGVAVAVVLAAAIGVVVASSGGDEGGYSSATEENFLAACTADGGEPVEPVCACMYDEIVENVPYDRFEAVNDALVAAREADPDAPVRLPRDFDEIRADCVEREGSEAEVTTSVAPEPEVATSVSAP